MMNTSPSAQASPPSVPIDELSLEFINVLQNCAREHRRDGPDSGGPADEAVSEVVKRVWSLRPEKRMRLLAGWKSANWAPLRIQYRRILYRFRYSAQFSRQTIKREISCFHQPDSHLTPTRRRERIAMKGIDDYAPTDPHSGWSEQELAVADWLETIGNHDFADRQVLEWVMQGFTFQEIGGKLGVPASTVWQRRRKITDRLKAWLNQHSNAPDSAQNAVRKAMKDLSREALVHDSSNDVLAQALVTAGAGYYGRDRDLTFVVSRQDDSDPPEPTHLKAVLDRFKAKGIRIEVVSNPNGILTLILLKQGHERFIRPLLVRNTASQPNGE